jgi:hypothetical protein
VVYYGNQDKALINEVLVHGVKDGLVGRWENGYLLGARVSLEP